MNKYVRSTSHERNEVRFCELLLIVKRKEKILNCNLRSDLQLTSGRSRFVHRTVQWRTLDTECSAGSSRHNIVNVDNIYEFDYKNIYGRLL